MSWQPTANIETLKQRAHFIAVIRQFFQSKQVLEVETPVLSRNTITDLHLDPFITQFDADNSGSSKPLYLQTSPEFHMKRLLAAGSGSIYQITKSFRNEPQGKIHNPEFTMLEWYRTDFDDQQLMAEVDELMQTLLATAPALKMSYQHAFLNVVGIDPLIASVSDLKRCVQNYSDDDWLQAEDNPEHILQWLFSMVIEPTLGKEQDVPCFIYDFPASQAALAKINRDNPKVAHRFELYYRGVELANGYYELQDEREQAMRFAADNANRTAMGKAQRPIDEQLLAALKHGLPRCAGVAVGVDRLFMLSCQSASITDVLAFDITNA